MLNRVIAIYFELTANLLMIDFKFLKPFVSGKSVWQWAAVLTPLMNWHGKEVRFDSGVQGCR